MPVHGGTIQTTTGTWSDLIQTAYDTTTSLYLHEVPTFRSFTDKRPVSQAMPGGVVDLTITGELPLATTPLTENLDVDAVAVPANRHVQVTLNEYGSALLSTRKLKTFDYTQDTIQRQARELAQNAAESVDKVYQNVLDGASMVIYSDGSNLATLTDPVASLGNLSSKVVGTAVTVQRRRLAKARFGDLRCVVAHPDVLHDLMEESGTNTWRQPHEQVDTAGIYTAMVGDFKGARFFSHTKCTIVAGTPDRYNTYFIDHEGLVEAVAEDVRVEYAPSIDKLNRFDSIGWYALLGVARFRENALAIVKTKSSIEALNLPAYDPKA